MVVVASSEGRAALDRLVLEHGLALAGATLSVQWGETRVLKVAGRIFALLAGPAEPWGLSLKVQPDSFSLLISEGVARPAPYLARAGWVRVDRLDAMPEPELLARIGQSHALVVAGLPRTLRAGLGLP